MFCFPLSRNISVRIRESLRYDTSQQFNQAERAMKFKTPLQLQFIQSVESRNCLQIRIFRNIFHHHKEN